MDLGLNRRVALVAASSRGLGRTIADGLADEGARVMISARDEAALAQTAREIREATGAEVDHHVTDLTQADDIRVLVKRTAERFGAWMSWSPTPEVLPPVFSIPSRTRIGAAPSS